MNATLADPFEPDDDVDRAYLDWLQANLFPATNTDVDRAAVVTSAATTTAAAVAGTAPVLELDRYRSAA